MPIPPMSLRHPLNQVVSDYQTYYLRKLELSLMHSTPANCRDLVLGQYPAVNGKKLCTIHMRPGYTPIQYNSHPHQYRVSAAQKSLAIQVLQAQLPLAPKFNDFEQLFDWICSILVGKNKPFSNPNLTIYDIALRYGFNLTPKILPNKYVYILSPEGTNLGLREYCSVHHGGRKPRKIRGYLVPTAFFQPLSILFSGTSCPLSMYIEDILCLYK